MSVAYGVRRARIGNTRHVVNLRHITALALLARHNGAVAVVTRVECSNGEIVETTKYLSLSLTTETVWVLSQAPTTANAMTGVTTDDDDFVQSYPDVVLATLEKEQVRIDAVLADAAQMPNASQLSTVRVTGSTTPFPAQSGSNQSSGGN